MATAREIRDQLRQWLDGLISFRQFEEWFVQVAGAIAAESDPEAEALVDDIDMSLSEYSDGVLTASELREELENAIRPFAPGPRNLSIEFYSSADDPRPIRKPSQVALKFGRVDELQLQYRG
jgi:hypothetical protein